MTVCQITPRVSLRCCAAAISRTAYIAMMLAHSEGEMAGRPTPSALSGLACVFQFAVADKFG